MTDLQVRTHLNPLRAHSHASASRRPQPVAVSDRRFDDYPHVKRWVFVVIPHDCAVGVPSQATLATAILKAFAKSTPETRVISLNGMRRKSQSVAEILVISLCAMGRNLQTCLLSIQLNRPLRPHQRAASSLNFKAGSGWDIGTTPRLHSIFTTGERWWNSAAKPPTPLPMAPSLSAILERP